MGRFLEVLRQAAIFMVAAKVILHFFPGNKYDRYGKMMVALIVLSILVVPVLGFFQEDMETAFWEETDRLEAENEMFTRKLEEFSAGQESIVENGLVLSVEEKVRGKAQEAGVSVRNVHIEDGTVVIEVEPDLAAGSQQTGVEPVEVAPVTIREAADVAEAEAGALKGRRRQDLAGIFATELGMEEGKVEVFEH